MKKLILVPLVCLFAALNAQQYCRAGAQWYYSVSYNNAAGYQHWQNAGDTVINNTACKILHGSEYITGQGITDTLIRQLPTIYTYNSGDTVYFCDTAFFAGYFFGAHPGDTIATPYMGLTGLSLVDTTGSEIYGSDTLRFYTFHLIGGCTLNPIDSFKVIELAGCTGTSIVPSWTCTSTNPHYYHICSYADSIITGYPDSSAICTTLTPYVPAFTYHHLLDSINIWHFATFVMGELPPPSNGGYSRSLNTCGDLTYRGFVYTGDTITINGLTYLQVNVKNTALYFNPFDSCLLGYIREDTLSGKVYFLNPGSTTEFLLYNFGMQLNDTISISFMNQGYFASGLYTLDAIDSFPTPAGMRGQYHLNCHNCSGSPELTWIEGIGNLADNIYPNMMNFQQWTPNQCNSFQYNFRQFVVCYEHNYKAYFDSCEYSFAYHNQSSPWGGGWTIVDSCDFFGGGGGINELSSLSSFTVYPNPASSYATISLNVTQNATFNICVKNMQGQNIIAGMQLENLAPGEHNINMNTSNIAQGIYLVECRTEAGVLYSKVVIQR